MTKRTIRAWAVLSSKRWDADPDELLACGNGREFQYPIFPTRVEASMWAGKAYDSGRLIRVTIQVGNETRKKGK